MDGWMDGWMDVSQRISTAKYFQLAETGETHPLGPANSLETDNTTHLLEMGNAFHMIKDDVVDLYGDGKHDIDGVPADDDNSGDPGWGDDYDDDGAGSDDRDVEHDGVIRTIVAVVAKVARMRIRMRIRVKMRIGMKIK